MSTPHAGLGSTKRKTMKGKRFSTEFWAKINAAYEPYGATTFSNTELKPVIRLAIMDEMDTADLVEEIVEDVLARFEKTHKQNHDQLEFFSEAEIIALGETMRIRRGYMTYEHLVMRKELKDKEQSASVKAYRKEDDWLNDRIEALRDLPGVTVREVFNEDGTRKRGH